MAESYHTGDLTFADAYVTFITGNESIEIIIANKNPRGGHLWGFYAIRSKKCTW
jgi:hypothetical protein